VTGPADRLVLQVATKQAQTDEAVADLLAAAIANLRAYNPGAAIVLIPINGGPGGAVCPSRNGGVYATLIHDQMVAAIAGAVGGDVSYGGDYPVADCNQFRDGRGHLTEPDGASYIGGITKEGLA
jgi:hypothetical protein